MLRLIWGKRNNKLFGLRLKNKGAGQSDKQEPLLTPMESPLPAPPPPPPAKF